MAKRSRSKLLILPSRVTDLAEGSGLEYWKQVLPESAITYYDDKGDARELDFDKPYLTDLTTAFREGALDQTPFQLADADNKHTMDAERYRGEVVDMKTADELPEKVTHGKTGLFAKIRFANKRDAKAIMRNPKLGVSARIREGVDRSDGKSWGKAIIHVLGTLDPKITGMSPWEPALDFSGYSARDIVIDLSSGVYKERTVAKNKNRGNTIDLATLTADDITADDFDTDLVELDDIDELEDDARDAFVEKYVAELDLDELTEEDINDFPDVVVEEFTKQYADLLKDEPTDEPKGKGKPAKKAAPAKKGGISLSNPGDGDLELAQQQAAQANATARDALKRVAKAEFEKEQTRLLHAGVPAAAIDLAAPIIGRANQTVIDLSNSDEDDVNVSEIVSGLLEMMAGTVDLAVENGHEGGGESGAASSVSQRAKMAEQFARDFPHIQ